MDINDVAAKVEQGVTALQTEQKEVKKNFDELQTTTKNAIGELTAIKNTVNSQAEVIARLDESVRMFNRERHLGGNPIARFCANETRSNWLVGCFKRAAGIPLNTGEVDAFKRTGVFATDSGIGGAVTPQETNSMIYDALLTYGQWSTLGVIPIGSRTQLIPLISARPTAYWVAQDAAIAEGAMTGTSVTLTVKEAGAWIPASRALLQDAQDNGTDMAAYLLEQLSQGVAYRLDFACFAADGTNDGEHGDYDSLTSTAGGTAATATAGNTTTAALDLEDFVRCLTTVSAGCLQRPCKWWIHPTILAKITQIRDSNGRPIFQTALEAPAPGAIGSILGYPVIVTAAMKSTDTTGNVIAVFGEPNGAAVGIRKSFELAQSDHFEFTSNNTVFRVIIRAGFVVKAATSFAKLTLA